MFSRLIVKYLLKQLRVFWTALCLEHIRWMVTLVFIAIFIWSMFSLDVRTAPALELFWGVVTMNFPTVIVFFYLAIVFAHNFVNVKYKRSGGFFEATAPETKTLSELRSNAEVLGEGRDTSVLIVEEDERA